MPVRHVEPLMQLGTLALFFAIPIIYSMHEVLVTSLPSSVNWQYTNNPLTGILECYRAGFFPGPVHWGAILAAPPIAVLALAMGWTVFSRMERQVLKEI